MHSSEEVYQMSFLKKARKTDIQAVGHIMEALNSKSFSNVLNLLYVYCCTSFLSFLTFPSRSVKFFLHA